VRLSETNSDLGASIWYLAGPDTGSSYIVSITFAGTVTDSTASAISALGVDQTTPLDSTSSASGTATTHYTTLTATSSEAFIVATVASAASDPANVTILGSFTERWSVDFGFETGAGSTHVATTTTYELGWDSVDSEDYTIVAAAFSEVLTANNRPTISSVSDTPDPIVEGNILTWSVDWNDADVEGVKTYVCKAKATSTSGCNGSGTWASYTATFDVTDPKEVTYTTQTADVGTIDWYAFVCDNSGDDSSCSDTNNGSTTITEIPIQGNQIKIIGGKIKIMSGKVKVQAPK